MAKEETKDNKPQVQNEIETMMMEKRRIFFSTGFDDKSAKEAIEKLWLLDHKEPGKLITLVINSPGGSVDSGFAIWDQITMISSPVVTLVTGLAASMGSFLSLVGGKGGRFATPNARFMIHQPAIHGVIQGQATDLEIQAKEVLKTRALLAKHYAEATGKSVDALNNALDRDSWMSAKEALEFGLIDAIVTSYDEVKAPKKK